MVEKTVAVLPGDGIGPEIMTQGLRVLSAVAEKYGHEFKYHPALVGGVAYERGGHPLPEKTIKTCRDSDAIYFGAVGGPKWANLPAELTPEKGALLPLRKIFDLYANLRPAVIFGPLADAASLRQDRLTRGLDILIIRELTGGIYFGNGKLSSPILLDSEYNAKGENTADVMVYSEPEIRRIAEVACNAAMKRNRKLTSVDKANVLDSSKLWRKIVSEYVERRYPEVDLNHLYVDNAAMQIATNPGQFDVIVTGNMFGDILSDLASAITGSIGMLPSASLNESGFGLYEPVHGSAPDIAGKEIANPLAQILSGAMMLRHSFNLEEEAKDIERAVENVLDEGYRTRDLGGGTKFPFASTSEMGRRVVDNIRN